MPLPTQFYALGTEGTYVYKNGSYWVRYGLFHYVSLRGSWRYSNIVTYSNNLPDPVVQKLVDDKAIKTFRWAAFGPKKDCYFLSYENTTTGNVNCE